MTQATQATFTSRTIAVEHIKISSERSFADVRRRLEGTLSKLDASIVEALRSGDQKRARDYEVTGLSCRFSRSAITASCCKFLAAEAMRFNMRLAIR